MYQTSNFHNPVLKTCRWLKFVATLLLGLLVCSCQQGSNETSVGQVEAMLVAATANGRQYGLRKISVAIVGPESVTLASNDLDPAEAVLTASLTSGNYTATIAAGWYLERLDTTPPTLVTAKLLTPNPLSFTVTSAATTKLTLQVEADGGIIEFAPGAVVVDFDVTETTPRVPLLSSASLSAAPLDIAATSSGAWVLTASSISHYASAGVMTHNLSHDFANPRAILANDSSIAVFGTITSTSDPMQYRRYANDGTVLSEASLQATSLLPVTGQVCVAQGANGDMGVVWRDGTDLVLRVVTSDGILLQKSTVFANPSAAACALTFTSDGSVVVGTVVNSQLQLTQVAPDATVRFTAAVGAGVVAPIQLAADGTANGYYTAYGSNAGLTVAHSDSTTVRWQTTVGDNTSTAYALLSGAFFGNTSISPIVGGRLDSSATGALITALDAASGSAFARMVDAGYIVTGMDTSSGPIAAVVNTNGISAYELRFYNR